MASQIEVEGTSLGMLLKRHRREPELSREALAEKAQMSARGVGDLEPGERRHPYSDTVAQLASAQDLGNGNRVAPEQAAHLVCEVHPQQEHDQGAAPTGMSSGKSLLVTKLTPPAPRADLVGRPRLLVRLDAGLSAPLILIAAPAGSGKTTLLGAWYETLHDRDIAAAWVSLDTRDNDPTRFWRYVMAAFEESIPGVDREALGLLELPLTAEIEPALTALVNVLAGLNRDVVLILEDYHCITAQAVHESVAFLLEHLPPHVHLVLATRADPPLQLARLRGRGLITEIRSYDLRFTLEEATTFLTEVMGLPLTDVEIGVLEQRTEGWIAGMQLAALSLQSRSDTEVAIFFHAFTHSHRHIVDFLTDDVLSRCSQPVQDFLLRTSILDRLNASLCASLLEDSPTGADLQTTQEILEEMERRNLFVVPLDDQREWYRYHNIFAEAMRRRLRHRRPEFVSRLYKLASDWFESQGLVEEAIEHALRAGGAGAPSVSSSVRTP